MEKKVTLRLHLEREEERLVYQSILKRDPKQFRTITDYVGATVLAYEKQKSKREEAWIQTLLEVLDEKGYLKPGKEKEKQPVEPEI